MPIDIKLPTQADKDEFKAHIFKYFNGEFVEGTFKSFNYLIFRQICLDKPVEKNGKKYLSFRVHINLSLFRPDVVTLSDKMLQALINNSAIVVPVNSVDNKPRTNEELEEFNAHMRELDKEYLDRFFVEGDKFKDFELGDSINEIISKELAYNTLMNTYELERLTKKARNVKKQIKKPKASTN